MKRNTLRLFVVLAVICVVGIFLFQTYWFRQAFNTESDRFHREVNTALFNVANQLFSLSDSPAPAANPVKQLSSNYYVVMINSNIDAYLLETLLKAEFAKRNILVDFEYGIYDCTNEMMVYGNYISMNDRESDLTLKGVLPKWENQDYYFGVHFPQRASLIINRMGIWVFSSVVLLIVVVFFSYSLFVILRQKQLSEVQKDFINNMTHEFKTPISTIALSTEVLKDPKIVDQPQRLFNYAVIIENENQRLKTQVERVLQVASLDKSKLTLKLQSINLHLLIEEVVDGIQLPLLEKNGQINLSLDASQPTIPGDVLHLSNVFYNLLDNAMKYCKLSPSIVISTWNEKNKLNIAIADNGIGIPHKEKQKVFNKFYRVPTGNVHDVKGFGLGLGYVKFIVNAHGGNIKLVSSVNEGSVFTLSLPYDKSSNTTGGRRS